LCWFYSPAARCYLRKLSRVAIPWALPLLISHALTIKSKLGSKPRTDKDFEFLQSQHIRYILNARFLPYLSAFEKRQAERYGMRFLSGPMNASPIAPSEKHVNQILLALRNPQFQPIYLHCVLGRDRTSLISRLYTF
jgi:protein tyrosine/serine phosphatase